MNSTWNGKRDTGPYQSNPLPKGMKVSRQVLRMFIFIFGTLVLVSYAYGVSHASDTAALWGGIPWSQAQFIVPFMFLAAFGFLMYWWIILYQRDAAVIADLRWPWGSSDGHGGGRLLLASPCSSSRVRFGLRLQSTTLTTITTGLQFWLWGFYCSLALGTS